MPLITLEAAKAHLRVTDAADDAKVQQLLNTVQLWAETCLQRRLFDDADSLQEAIVAVPAALTAASAAHDAAVATAEQLTDEVAAGMALTHACRAYQAAQAQAAATYAGMVVNDAIREGMLIALTALYDGRATGDLPKGATDLIQPWRHYG